jgi:cell division protein FtsN
VRAGMNETADVNLRTLLEIERDRACGQTAPANPPASQAAIPPASQAANPPASQAANPPASQAANPPANPPAVSAASTATGANTGTAAQGAFAIQTGAFRELRGAQSVAAQLRAQNIDARVVTIPGSQLYRVRVGTFASNAAAVSASQRVRAAGFAIIIVDDVRNERLVRDEPRT